MLQLALTTGLIDTIAGSILIYILLSLAPAHATPKPSEPKIATPRRISPENIPQKIIVSRFKIIGNQVIPPEEIDQALAPYLFRPISFIELLKVQEVITNLYIEKGYLTSGAFIPPQTITNRTIEIEIIEGKVEEIEILGLKELHPEYIRSRLAIATEPPLNQDKLLNALQILQLDPLIKNISAELSKGINPGGGFLTIEIEEAPTSNLTLELNNQSSPSIGSLTTKVSISDNNLLGFGDRFNVSYVNTAGSDSLENLSYLIPIGAYDSKIRVAHSINDSQIITQPFRELDLESKNRYYEITYLQTLHLKPTENVVFGGTFTHQNSQLSLGDLGFPDLARGSDREGKTRISAVHLFQEYSDRSQNHVLAARSQFSIGIDAFDSTINNNESPDSNFLLWRGQAQYLQKLTPSTNLLLRGDLQVADRPLVSLEQFSAGGVSSVRGYSEDRILGDNGLFLSVELRNTVWQTSENGFSLEVNPFFDFGRVWNSGDLVLETNTLASLGVGLQLLIGDSLNARVDWGFPLINDNLSGDSLQEQGVHFSLQFKPL